MPTPATHVWRPSSARVVVLDGFVPVPRGTPAAAPAAPCWPAKDPGDVLDYSLDIAAAVAGNPGDVIATLDVAIAPNGPADLGLNSAGADGTRAVLWLAGGQPGTVYTVTLTIGLSSGRAVVRSVLLPVLGLASEAALANGLLTDSGTPVTDQSGSPILVVKA